MKKVLLFVVALVVLSGCGYKAPPYYEPKSEEVKKVAL
ncbi:MAG: lipoprotein [Sulfuricurvum sp.]|nr:lipoprotein [Sulfuricurvum sp.]MDD2828284.1 lipoprotein [Sulfuricurvum sp.]MDD4949761.1 lipoprotein [Sulfuricurvum sp.]